MNKKIVWAVMVSAGLALSACNGKDDDPMNQVTTANDSNNEDSGSTSGAPVTTTIDPTNDTNPPETSGASESSGGGDSGETGAVFLVPPDGGGVSFECDLFAQDCPEGEKCMPWANDGGTSWNATRCSPIDPDPDAPGEPCTVEGSATSGIDSCALAAMCFDVDPLTNEGTCYAMCNGSLENPLCAEPDDLCVLFRDEVALCQDTCQPLMPTCAEDQGCYPSDGGFVCWWPAEMLGVYGEECDYINACAPGHTCADGASFPSCAGASCCTEYCDTAAGLPCPEADQGVTCVPWYEDGMAPPGYETVGICTLPP